MVPAVLLELETQAEPEMLANLETQAQPEMQDPLVLLVVLVTAAVVELVVNLAVAVEALVAEEDMVKVGGIGVVALVEERWIPLEKQVMVPVATLTVVEEALVQTKHNMYATVNLLGETHITVKVLEEAAVVLEVLEVQEVLETLVHREVKELQETLDLPDQQTQVGLVNQRLHQPLQQL